MDARLAMARKQLKSTLLWRAQSSQSTAARSTSGLQETPYSIRVPSNAQYINHHAIHPARHHLLPCGRQPRCSSSSSPVRIIVGASKQPRAATTRWARHHAIQRHGRHLAAPPRRHTGLPRPGRLLQVRPGRHCRIQLVGHRRQRARRQRRSGAVGRPNGFGKAAATVLDRWLNGLSFEGRVVIGDYSKSTASLWIKCEVRRKRVVSSTASCTISYSQLVGNGRRYEHYWPSSRFFWGSRSVSGHAPISIQHSDLMKKT
jgi:hypothetical protein